MQTADLRLDHRESGFQFGTQFWVRISRLMRRHRRPDRQVSRRRAQRLSSWPRLSRPPEGLGLDWPEHGGILDRIETAGARHIVGKFNRWF